MRTGTRMARRVAALVDVLAARQAGDRQPGEAAEHDLPARGPATPGAREARAARRRAPRRRPRARRRARRGPSRARSRAAARARAASRARRGRAHARYSGPKERGSSASSVGGLARAGRRAQVDSASRLHELAQPLAAAAAGHADLVAVADHRGLGDPRAPRGHERADRRRLGALALRVGGVLDVGADVDRAVVGPQRRADAVAGVRRVARAPSPRGRRRPARRSRRPGRSRSCAAIRSGTMSSASVSWAHALELDAPGRSPPWPRPRARGSRPRPATRSRWMRTFCHSSRWRSFSTTASRPSEASSAAAQPAGSSTGMSR